VPGKTTGSVHESEFKRSEFLLLESEIKNWDDLFVLRKTYLPILELNRRDKIIGKSLDAKINLVEPMPLLANNQKLQDAFKELLNVSQLGFLSFDDNPEPNYSGKLVVHADGQKCERCWHWETDIGQHTEHPTICGRCVEAVKQFKA
jgi:isoleucyl-tRNA synthetase